MSDISKADAHSFWGSSGTSPGSTKTKKEYKKNKKGLKDKNNVTLQTDDGIQKKRKKKNSKFKVAMEDKKQKKKERKKKKTLKLDGSFVFTQVNSASDSVAQWMKPEQTPAVKPAASNPSSAEMNKHGPSTQHWLTKKKTKQKKKVAFDLSPGYICIKRPKFISQSPRDSILTEGNVKKDSERRLHSTMTGQSQGQPHDSDSQCTADDMNSQDLFITQKTFRVSPSEPSSGETNDKAVIMLTKQEKESHTPLTLLTPNHEHTCSRDPHRQAFKKVPHFHQPPSKVKKRVQESHKVHTLLSKKVEGLHTTHAKPNKGKLSFQRQMESNKHLNEETKASKVVNAYLEQSIGVNTYLDITKQMKHPRPSGQWPSPCLQQPDEQSLHPQMSRANASTQTENFFTSELAYYLRFCQRNRVTSNLEDLKPLDLSLPHRVRAAMTTAKTSAMELKDEDEKFGDMKLSSPRDINDDNDTESPSCKVKKGSSRQCPLSASTKGKAKKVSSSYSESEPKSSGTTTLSEDNETNWRSCRVVPTQVKAVQMRLNESFFFRTKGEGQSPRPESPLMKLVQGREKKSKKSH